ncbi:radical SAM protein [candidate division WOR-3 bacterium]|nr:radical SAM protein [candidate division WOR-3 bacterium]MCK4575096.1 radical SAM protein [candidate division WOR-3 bacterium]
MIISTFKKPASLNKTGDFSIFYPIHFSIELTYNCNLKCIHCYANAGYKHFEYINTDKLLKFLDISKEKGLTAVELTGGEPLVHPDFFKILDYCVNNLRHVGILTNGTFLMKRKQLLKNYARFKKSIFFSVSLYGPKPKIHEQITGVKGSFKKVLEGIKVLLDLGFFVRVSMTLTSENVDYLEETLDFSHGLGAHIFSWDNSQPTGRGKFCNSNYKHDQLVKIHSKTLVEKYPKFVILLTEEQLEDKKRFGNCGAGHKNVTIDPKGDVRPCAFIHDEFIPFGNISKSPREVFGSPELSFWANLCEPSKEICKNCEYLPYCAGCPVRAIFSMRKKGEICEWAKKSHIKNHLKFILEEKLD